jgi:hypothetical protein
MTIQVSIKSSSGLVVVEVDSTKTIADIKKLAIERDASISSTKLILENKSLDDDKTLIDYNINQDITLTAQRTEPTVTGSPAKRTRKRCSFKACISAPLRGVGDCGFCEGHFCSRHRLLEQHDCIGLQNCKQQLHE